MKSKLLTLVLVVCTTAAFSQVDSADFFYQKGLKEKELGRKLEVWKAFDKAYKYNPNSKEIVTELAQALVEMRKYAQAKEMYQNLEKFGDKSAALYKQLMDLSYNTKQFDDALVYAQKLKTADPSAPVNFYAGKIYYDRDNYGEAIKCLTVAQKEEPNNAEAPYLIARCYADMMNYKLAIPYFQKAIEMDQTKGNWVYELGLICYAMHADKDALKYIVLAADRGYKKDNDYMENLGIAHLNVGNLNDGLAILKEILVKKPSDMNLLNMIAEAYYFSGKFPEAIEYWDQVLTYDKTNAQALYMIGLSYQKKGEKDKGVALCDKAIEMDPSLASLKQKKSMMGL